MDTSWKAESYIVMATISIAIGCQWLLKPWHYIADRMSYSFETCTANLLIREQRRQANISCAAWAAPCASLIVVLSLTAAPDSLCGKARNSWPKMLLQTEKIVMQHFLARLIKHDTACLWSCSGCNDWKQGKECFLAFIKKATWVLTSAPESCADYSLTDDVIGDKENCYAAVLLPRWFQHDTARCWSYTGCCDWRLSWTYPLTPLLEEGNMDPNIC